MLLDDHPLLACLRSAPSAAASVPPLTAVEWTSVVQQAIDTGLTPLLYARLRARGCFMSLPTTCRDLLARHYRQSAEQNLRLLIQTRRLLSRLQQQQVPVIILKGLHLAHFVYPEAALRTMGDVDLLVPITYMPAVEQALHELDCLPLPRSPHRQVADDYHQRYRFPADGGYLEVHWHLHRNGDQPGIDLDAIWHRAKRATLAGVDVYLLSTPDLLVYLCYHVTKHRFTYRGLRSLVDIAELLQGHLQVAEWPLVLQRAQSWQLTKQLYLVLLLVERLLGVATPPALLAELKPPAFDAELFATAVNQLWHKEQAQLSTDYVKLWQPGSLMAKARLLLAACFLPKPTMVMLYPAAANAWLLPCFYPVRWFVLMHRYALVTWTFLRGNRHQLMHVQRIQLLNAWLAWSDSKDR